MTASLPQLARKLSTKIETGRGVRLSAQELDLLVHHRAYAVLCEAAVESQQKQCLNRSVPNQSMSEVPFASIDVPTVPISRSSGTTSNHDANEALARARAMTKRASSH